MKKRILCILNLCFPLLTAAQVRTPPPCALELGNDKIPCRTDGWMGGGYDTVRLGDGMFLYISSSGASITYRWERTGGPEWWEVNGWHSASELLSDTTIANPLVRTEALMPGESIGFSLTVTDSTGCEASSTINVVLVEALCTVSDFPVYIDPGDTVQIGGGCSIFPDDVVTYYWRPDSTLVNPSVSTPLAFPSQTTYYTYDISYGNGCYESTDDGQLVIVQPLAVEEKTLEPEITLYPNPATGQLYISHPAIKGPLTVELFSLTGQRVLRTQLAAPIESIQVGHLAEGLYWAKLTIGDGRSEMKRVVIEK